MKTAAAFAIVMLCLSASGLAQADREGPIGPLVDAPGHGKTHTALAYPHPTPPSVETTWPAPMLMIVTGMFIAAAVIGPIVRMEMGDEQESHAHGHDDAHGHDHDDPGHGHHH